MSFDLRGITMIPKDVYFKDGDCCSVGSLTAPSLALTYSEDEGVVLSSPKRWNCDAGLVAHQRGRKNQVLKSFAVPPSSHDRFRDPEFFPPFVSMMSQESLEKRSHEDKAESDSESKRRLSCNLFGNRRISTHSRIEMLRHQMSKPFRALPLPTPPKIDAKNCMGKSILQSVVNQVQGASVLDCSKSRKLARRSSQKEDIGKSAEEGRSAIVDGEYPSDEEMEQDRWQTLRKPSMEEEPDCFKTVSANSSQSIDFSFKMADVCSHNEPGWLRRVATEESSVDENAVELLIDLD